MPEHHGGQASPSRALACADLDSAADHYLSQADVAVATRFIDAFQRAT